jgi:hypothetical protein
MSDYVCEMCPEEARWVFVSLDTVVSAACEGTASPCARGWSSWRLSQLARA